MLVETEEEKRIVEMVDEGESGGKEVARVVEKGNIITVEAQVPKSPQGSPSSAQKVSRSSTPSLISSPSFFEVTLFFASVAPPSTLFFA